MPRWQEGSQKFSMRLITRGREAKLCYQLLGARLEHQKLSSLSLTWMILDCCVFKKLALAKAQKRVFQVLHCDYFTSIFTETSPLTALVDMQSLAQDVCATSDGNNIDHVSARHPKFKLFDWWGFWGSSQDVPIRILLAPFQIFPSLFCFSISLIMRVSNYCNCVADTRWRIWAHG